MGNRLPKCSLSFFFFFSCIGVFEHAQSIGILMGWAGPSPEALDWFRAFRLWFQARGLGLDLILGSTVKKAPLGPMYAYRLGPTYKQVPIFSQKKKKQKQLPIFLYKSSLFLGIMLSQLSQRICLSLSTKVFLSSEYDLFLLPTNSNGPSK